MCKYCTPNVCLLESVFFPFLNWVVFDGRIWWFSRNQPICRVIQHALFITLLDENRHCALSALSEIHSTFTDKPLRSATIYLRLKKLEDGVADELVEIVGQSPNCTSKYLATFFNCWNNIIIGWLNEFCNKRRWLTWIRHNLLPQPCSGKELATIAWSPFAAFSLIHLVFFTVGF